jgi:glutamate--cysteine ligase
LLNRRLDWLRRPDQRGLMRGGLRGVEKETLRVDFNGQLSRRSHPEKLGSALTHPVITTDYSEALLELVTPPLSQNWAMLQFLCDTHAFIHRNLDEELLWPASMPCVVNANEEIPIADYGKSNLGLMKTIYRRGLGHRYGRAMQAIAGIHFNYSPPRTLWEPYLDAEGFTGTVSEFRSLQLMALVRNFRRTGWLVMYLFGASPAFCKSFMPDGDPRVAELDASTWFAPFATSLRMSDVGYRNKSQARLHISANSLAEYLDGLTAAVTTTDPRFAKIGVKVDSEYRQLNDHVLQIENEYYSAIRPKPRKSDRRTTRELRHTGVEYVEVRSLDLNPAHPAGIGQSEMRMLETLLLFCLLDESPPIDAEEQAEIDARDLVVAREGRRPDLTIIVDGKQHRATDVAYEIFDCAAEIADLLDGDGRDYSETLAAYRETLGDPDRTPSARMLAELRDSGGGFFRYALDVAKRHRDYFLALPLSADREAAFERMARESLEATERSEQEPAEPFESYLARYAEAV